MATLPPLRLPFQLETAAFARSQRQIESSVRQMGRTIQTQNQLAQTSFARTTRAVGVLRTGLAGLGVGIAAGGFAALVKGSLDAADALAKTSRQLGVTVESLQGLRLGADLAGVGTAGLDKNLERFVKRLGEADAGSGDLRKTLERNNIELRDSAGQFRSTNDLLNQYADLIARAQSPQEKLALSTAAFGREGTKMVELLKDGSVGLREFQLESERAGQISQQQAEAAERTNDAITRLSTTLSTNFARALGETIILGEQAASVLNRLTGESIVARQLVGITPLGRLLTALAEQLPAVETKERALLDSISPTSAAMEDQATAAAEAAESLDRLLESAGRENEQLTALKAAHEGYGSTVESVTGAIAIDNQLRSAKITQLNAEESGLLALLVANQKLAVEIDAVTEAEKARAQAAKAAGSEQAQLQKQQAAQTQRLLETPKREASPEVQKATAVAFKLALAA